MPKVIQRKRPLYPDGITPDQDQEWPPIADPSGVPGGLLKTGQEIESDIPGVTAGTELTDEESASGHMPNPERIDAKSALERAQEVGLYTESTDAHPEQVGIAEEVEENEEQRQHE